MVFYTTSLLQGLRNKKKIVVNEELATIYEKWVEENPFENEGGGWAAEPWHQKEMHLSDELVSEASYQLTVEEKTMIKVVSKYFKQVVVVLNVSNIIDMGWINDESYLNPIKSVIDKS